MIYQVNNLTLAYPQMPPVVHSASFELNEGETMTILGPNGAGKSTLLNSLMGLHEPENGDILLNERPLTSLGARDIAGSVAYVRQYQTPVFAYTIRDYVMMGRAPRMGVFSRPKNSDNEAVDRALEIMDLTDLADRPYTDISGGQRQKAAIARALAQEPKAILLDEPTAHLDFGNQIRIVKLVQMLSGLGYAVVMTTHDPNQAIILGGKLAVLDKNGILTVGSVEDMMNERDLCTLYDTELKYTYVESVGRQAVLASSPHIMKGETAC